MIFKISQKICEYWNVFFIMLEVIKDNYIKTQAMIKVKKLLNGSSVQVIIWLFINVE